MMKSEFEALANIIVTDQVYDKIIEPMYMATNISKQEFVKYLNLDALLEDKRIEAKDCRVNEIFDSYVDELDRILVSEGSDAMNRKIYEIQSLILNLRTHHYLDQHEYETLNTAFRQCVQ